MIRFTTVLVFFLLAGTIELAHAQLRPISRISEYVKQYSADKSSLQRKYLLKENPDYYTRMEKLYTRWLAKMSHVDYDKLSVDEAVDFILLRRNVRRDLRKEKEAKASFEKIKSLIPFRNIIKDIRENRLVGKNLNGQKLAEQMTALSESVIQTEDSLKQMDRLSDIDGRQAVKSVQNLQKNAQGIL